MNFQHAVDYLRQWLRDTILAKSGQQVEACPVCGHQCSLRKRKLNSGQVRIMVHMFHYNKRVRHVNSSAWVDMSLRNRNEDKPDAFIAEIKRNRSDFAKLRWWGLLEERPAGEQEVELDGRRAAFWRLTPLALKFLAGQISVVEYYRVMFNQPVKQSKRRVYVIDIIADFDLNDTLYG